MAVGEKDVHGWTVIQMPVLGLLDKEAISAGYLAPKHNPLTECQLMWHLLMPVFVTTDYPV